MPRYSKNFGISPALLISITAHAVFLAILIWGALLFRPLEFAGNGGVVDVMFAIPDGDTGSGSGKTTHAASAKAAAKVVSSHLDENKLSEPKQSEDNSILATAGNGQSGSSAESENEGGRHSMGGNPVLARIWKKIDSNKYYPSAARRMGIAGAPRVTFEIAEDGSVKWVKLAETSGDWMLDDAAVETVRRAAPLPYYEKPITLAVRYSIGK